MSNTGKDQYVSYDLPTVQLRRGETTIVASDPVSPGGRVRPVGLEVDASVARHVLVTDLKVGKNSQFISVGGVPASLFALGEPVDLRMDDVPPGLRIILNLTNIGEDHVEFRSRLRVLGPGTASWRRSFVVGLGSTSVPPGKTLDVAASPMANLRVRRLHVPHHLLDVFRVEDVFQGRYLDVQRVSEVYDHTQLGRENLAAGGAIEMTPFPYVGVSSSVTVKVTNVSGETQSFTGALVGDPQS